MPNLWPHTTPELQGKAAIRDCVVIMFLARYSYQSYTRSVTIILAQYTVQRGEEMFLSLALMIRPSNCCTTVLSGTVALLERCALSATTVLLL